MDLVDGRTDGLKLSLKLYHAWKLSLPTLALTLFAFALYGYTLNRITLFALIFSIGILVDDAIVVVENVVRHARMQTGEASALAALTVRAVDEVGNPTILATLTVVAAILPMAFVGGLMGPYMRPIPLVRPPRCCSRLLQRLSSRRGPRCGCCASIMGTPRD